MKMNNEYEHGGTANALLTLLVSILILGAAIIMLIFVLNGHL